MSVSLTLKKEGDKDKEPVLVYHFGSETRKEKGKEKEMAGVYGLIVSGSDLKDTVFVVPEQVVSVLKDAELRDRTVFKFDPDKVKEVKLEIKDRGEIRKPVFERKKATGPWTVKSGVEGFDLNSDKVEILVNYLSDLKAERYINFTGPDKSHQLDKDAKLKIEVVMDDNKTTHKLEIGALEGMTYFAQSNSLPGAVFTVPQSRFQPILDNWLKHFGKGE